MPKGKRRDIYRGRFDAGFDINNDVDLAHMRELMTTEELSNEEYNYYGLYVTNVIKIMLNASSFRGYDEDVKESIMGEALYDCLRARMKFDGAKYPQPSAPFNYAYRIAFRSAQHVLSKYYEMQNRMVAASHVGEHTKLADGFEDFTDDIIDKAVNDWDKIAENLRATTGTRLRKTSATRPGR